MMSISVVDLSVPDENVERLGEARSKELFPKPALVASSQLLDFATETPSP